MPRKYARVKDLRAKKRSARLKLLKDLLEAQQQKDEVFKEEEDQLPLPDTLEEFMPYVWWPHVETKEPVNELADIGAEYLRDRTCFRWDENGHRIAGSDILMKPRRGFVTTLTWACIFYCLIRWNNLRSLTAFQVGSLDEIIEPAVGKVVYMLTRLPQHWLGRWRRKGNTIYLGKRWVGRSLNGDPWRDGGQWTPISSGHTARIADKRGRSADCDIFHASETCVIPYPEALFSAVGKALPAATGMMISESTLPNLRTQFQAAEYFATLEGRSMFLKAFFWRWFDQPFKRIPRDVPDFDKFMSKSFERFVPDTELAREITLNLSDEQKAFRRREFFTGSADKRRLARRENPESVDEAFVSEGETHFDIEAIERAAALTRPPLNDDRHPLGRHFGISIWDERPQGFLLIGVDVAQKEGKDFTAVVALEAQTMNQVAEIHGRALASEMAQALAWLLERLDKNRREYLVVIESNHGKALIGECLKLKLKLFSEVARAKSKKAQKTIRRWGLSTQGYNRNKIIDAIGEGLEGPRLDQDGEPRTLCPPSDIPSERLVEEMRQLVWSQKKNRVQAAQGHHDDLAIAYGLARYIAPTTRIPGSARAHYQAAKRNAQAAPAPARASRGASRRGGAV